MALKQQANLTLLVSVYLSVLQGILWILLKGISKSFVWLCVCVRERVNKEYCICITILYIVLA